MQLSLFRRPRTALALALVAAATNAQTGEPTTFPIPFPTSHDIVLDGYGGIFGTIYATAADADADEGMGNPEQIAVDSTPFGPGTVTPTSGGWHVDFQNGEEASVTMVPAWGCFAIDFTTSGLTGFLVDSVGSYVAQGPQGPGGEVGAGGKPSKGGGIDLFATWPPSLGPWIHQVDFFQFVRVEVKLIRVPAGGQPRYEHFPPGTKFAGTINGGRSASPSQLAGGAGQFEVDGTKTYVDSGSTSTGGYISGGAAGHVTDTSAQMHDRPNVPAGQVAGKILSCGLPDFWEIVGYDVIMDFTNYFVVDGVVTYGFSYRYTQRTIFSGPLLPGFPVSSGSCSVPLHGPASSMDPGHQQVLNDFGGGNYGGLVM